jgi:23S rRNA (cytosine1962-C5)-methyltransferase
VTLVRPEAQAEWRPAQGKAEWDAAQGEFVQSGRAQRGEWRFSREVPARWKMQRGNLSFWVEPAPAGHVGLFPDQAAHWDWMSALIEARTEERKRLPVGMEVAPGKAVAAQPAAVAAPKILSLFGYTGLATLACAAAGAQVTQVDASHKAIKWAGENQALSQLENRALRWLIDDAPTFVAREIRRGRTYDGLILDPPRFGRGPRGELWKVEEALPALLKQCRKILSPAPLFVLLNTYTTVLTRGQTASEAAQLHACLQEMLADKGGASIASGELVLRDRAGRQVSNSVFARATMRE